MIQEMESIPEPEDEASVSEESPDPGERAGRLSKGVRKPRGDLSLWRNRWTLLWKQKDNNTIQTLLTVTLFVSLTVSLIAFGAMALLAFFEFFIYRDTWMKYEYEVYKDYSR